MFGFDRLIRAVVGWLHPQLPTSCPACDQPVTPEATDPHVISCPYREAGYRTVRRAREAQTTRGDHDE